MVVSKDQEELQELLQRDRSAPVPEPDLVCSCTRCGAPAPSLTLLCVVHERAEAEAILAEDAKEQQRFYEQEAEGEQDQDPGYDDRGPW